MINQETAISVEKVSKSFGEVKAVDDVSISVQRNELFGLIGPDGAGKTTLMRILTTLLLPDSGQAGMNGHDVVKGYKHIRKETGYMPGRFSLYMDLSVEENLKFYATIFGTTIEENYELIEGVYSQIEPFRKRKAKALSGGMKQKLALSCALIHKPTTLVLDEPTTGVDAVSRKEFWEMLQGLKEKGITILVSTPYMDEAGLCDRVALMQKGRVMITDTPEGVRERFRKELLAIETDNMYRLLQVMRQYPQTESIYPFGQVAHYTGKEDEPDALDIRRHLEQNKITKFNIRRIRPDIEDCFMAASEGRL